MIRLLRYLLVGIAGVLGLLIALVVFPLAAGVIAGYLSAPKPVPKAVEIVRYVRQPTAASSASPTIPSR